MNAVHPCLAKLPRQSVNSGFVDASALVTGDIEKIGNAVEKVPRINLIHSRRLAWNPTPAKGLRAAVDENLGIVLVLLEVDHF